MNNFPKDTRKPKKLVAAMSGGVDSSVAAWLMKERGIEVIGATLILKKAVETGENTKSCCNLEDQIQVKKVCEKIDIPHVFLDYQEEFTERVLASAWADYSTGFTPNPCILCNRFLKFGMLHDYAKEIGADGIFTGHYAHLSVDEEGSPWLVRGDDNNKDQTYFLMGIARENLLRTYFPLGEYDKPQIRAMAKKIELSNAKKAESQDACFGLSGEAFPDTLRRFFKADPKPGLIVDTEGKELGRHEGIHRYTIGQRKGLGVALGVPGYVSSIDRENNRVVLTTDQKDLQSTVVEAENVNWLISADQDYTGKEFIGQVRYGHKGSPATIEVLPDDSIRATFLNPQRAVTLGQGLAIYDNKRLICGGRICKVS